MDTCDCHDSRDEHDAWEDAEIAYYATIYGGARASYGSNGFNPHDAYEPGDPKILAFE